LSHQQYKAVIAHQKKKMGKDGNAYEKLACLCEFLAEKKARFDLVI
jgi:hypothetical protein